MNNNHLSCILMKILNSNSWTASWATRLDKLDFSEYFVDFSNDYPTHLVVSRNLDLVSQNDAFLPENFFLKILWESNVSLDESREFYLNFKNGVLQHKMFCPKCSLKDFEKNRKIHCQMNHWLFPSWIKNTKDDKLQTHFQPHLKFGKMWDEKR